MQNCPLDDPFINQILEERKCGYGFVPLLGSGLSAPSGIPIIRNIQRYLDKCICRAQDETDPWDAMKGPWPPLDGINESAQDTTWAEKICDEFKTDIRKSAQRSQLQSGILGALGDWRAALQLVSRIRKSPKPTTGFKIDLIAPADHIIDSFFNHLTGGRHPNLAHTMLAQLADTLRFNTIITTNFDSLVETSFSSMAVPLEVFEVHRDGLLPDSSLVLKQRSIVKMNGGRFELIASITLDQEPSPEDKDTFIRYLNAASETGIENHLLVMGTSGTERRTIGLIRHALATLRKLRVFWVHYGPDGAELKSEKISDVVTALIPEDDRKRIIATSRPDFGMFLLQLYEQRYLSLPPSGANFPALWRLPPYRCELIEKDAFESNLKILTTAVNNLFSSTTTSEPPGILVVNGATGLSSVAADVFLALEPNIFALWLELDQFADVEQFYVALLQAVFAKLGRASQLSVVTHLDLNGCARQLEECKSGALDDFLIFINAREGAGHNVGRSGQLWNTEAKTMFWQALKRFAEIGYRFVILIDDTFFAPGWPYTECSTEFLINKADDIVKTVMQWLLRQDDHALGKQRFLYALTLMRNSRHLPVLLSWPFLKATKPCDVTDNDLERKHLVFRWLLKLQELNAIRFQRAGSVWLHATIRDALREALPKVFPWLLHETQTIHQGIADWYVKLFRACNDPQAVLESLYHRLQCILAMQTNNERALEFVHIQQSAVLEALGGVELARDRILSCGYFYASETGIEDLADAIQESLHSPKSAILQIRCQELIRDISRQITQFARASEANRKISNLLPPLASPEPPTPELAGDFISTLSLMSEEAAILTGIRSYEQAHKCLMEFFTGAQRHPHGDFWPISKDQDVPALREKARKWAIEVTVANPDLLQLTIRSLRRYVLLEMLCGQAKFMASRSLEEEQKCHKQAERAYIIAAEMMRFVEDGDFLSIENAYLRTHIGVALARLGRFYEAHRRLNEASGYLSQSRRSTDAMAWAVLDIRRAEVWFTEYERRRAVTVRERMGLLQDAWSSLQRAEARLVGHRQDIWWWTLVYELQVRICRALVELSTFPKSEDDLDPEALRSVMRKHIRKCVELANAEMRLISIDVFRQARLVEELEAIVKHDESNSLQETLVRARQHMQTVTIRRSMDLGAFPLDGDLQTYVNTFLLSSTR